MPKIGPTSKCLIRTTSFRPPANFRPAVQVSLGCHIEGVAQPHVDPGDRSTVEAGVRKRALCEPPKPNRTLLRRLTKFVNSWCKKNLVPIRFDSDTSVKAWLEKTNYPQTRKEELLRLWTDCNGHLRKKDFVVKSFVKAETYPEYKHARGINSRTDVFKCAVGPIFKLIEEEVFKHKSFIKKIPIAERPKYIANMLSRVGARFGTADFTAFESHFTRLIMKAIEIPMYSYMTQFLPDAKEFMGLVNNVIAGKNVCQYKFFDVIVEAKRMSGEMNTSLGNGFTNLMLILFTYSEVGENVECVVEGDDSLVSFMNAHPSIDDFRRLGFTIKMEISDAFEDASFCGLIFDPVDLINITDPMDALSSFGWASKFYVGAKSSRILTLLRCKALSYAHQYPGCPIIQSLSHYALRCTRSYDVRKFIDNDRGINNWERDNLRMLIGPDGKILKVPYKQVPLNTRHLMERKFGIDVPTQLKIERYLDTLNCLQVLAGPLLELDFGLYHDYFSRYSSLTFRNDPDIDYPLEPWVKMKGFVSEF